jgi:hypothetical protein
MSNDAEFQACQKTNRMCVQLAWIYETGYGGVVIDLKKSKRYSKQGCMFGESLRYVILVVQSNRMSSRYFYFLLSLITSCLHYLRLREEFSPSQSFAQAPPFADPRSREFYERAVLGLGLGAAPEVPKAAAAATAKAHLNSYKEMLLGKLRVSTQTQHYRSTKAFR